MGSRLQQSAHLAFPLQRADAGSARERIYFDYFWNYFAADKTRLIPEANRKAYATAYPVLPTAARPKLG